MASTVIEVGGPGPSGNGATPPLAVGARAIVVAAGPCAVEGREMLLEVARAVRTAGAAMLRGGAFKARTSPYAFQGLGAEALAMLAEARAETGLAVVTEVLDPRHVELVAAHADVLQIGARNMQNYALLAEAGRVGRPVLLKRGFAATIEEVLLAAEYILSNGNPDVILCERGIRSFESKTRNTLDVAAVPALKAETHLPVFVDPSHAGGRADLVMPLSCAAIAAGADGLLVEVHPDPAHALSDGEQSLTPQAFGPLMDRLEAFAAAAGREIACAASLGADAPGNGTDAPPALARVRAEIERVDAELIALMARRVSLARQAGRVKREAGLPVIDTAQEGAVLSRARELAEASGLPDAELRELLQRMIAVSRAAQAEDAARDERLRPKRASRAPEAR
ncbi:MAG TPA: 3-deoxy-7-phosphoheptulonate synthase [Gemmatimonadaceae bacterium]|nr:3-deoxy-7-phosphoheptulonate synthase [Gemmatimonadaceae bacterium]